MELLHAMSAFSTVIARPFCKTSKLQPMVPELYAFKTFGNARRMSDVAAYEAWELV
jgi:hypothetical protein